MLTLDRLIDSWIIDLRGRHLARKTVSTYERSARALAAWLTEQGRACAHGLPTKSTESGVEGTDGRTVDAVKQHREVGCQPES